MDRSKSSNNVRAVKGKISLHPSDLYALGSKPSSSTRDVEVKRPSATPHSKLGSSSLSNQIKDRKRDAGSTSIPVIPAKKPKVFPIPGGSRSLSTTDRPLVSEQWENNTVDSEDGELVINVLNSVADNDLDKAIAYLLGGLKSLKSQKYKPELVLINSIAYIIKMKPSLFRNDDVTQAIFTLLRRDSVSSFKSKGNPQVPIFAVNLLMKAYEEVRNWPQLFFKYYLEDALGDRIWVDHELCTSFVENMQTAFNTKIPPKSLLQVELTTLGNRGDTGSPLTVNDDDILSSDANGRKRNLLEKCNIPVYSRYSQSIEYTEQMVLDASKEHLLKKQPSETVTKNFLRFLASASGLVEIRMLSVSKLEMWLHNAKLMRSAQDLLVYLCYNSAAETQRDIEVISHLIKIRFKTKALVNVFLSCLRDMIASHEQNLPVVLKHTIYNELSNARNPNNMLMIGVIFQTSPEHAANVLAEIFLELLLNKDDYLRPLRALLREIVRVLRYDIDMYVFCHALIRERKESTNAIRDFEFKDRIFMSVADLICLCMFLAVSPAVREAANLVARGEKKELPTLQKFQNQVSKIQSDALWWLHDTVRIYRPNAQDFISNLRKVLLLDPVENYCKHDMWPSENERNILMRLCTEVPLSQSTFIRILLIGLSKDHPLQPIETLDFCDPLVKRAAVQTQENTSMLQFDKLDIIDLIFNLCTYHHPENITLPVGYTPPQLAISNLYWKGWIMLLILAAHNPITFGSAAWEKYPTLRIFMEMCITNHFTYPPPTMAMCENYEELKSKEMQIAALEKQQILEFESHLAAASTKISINESNSLLLPQLITMSPMGISRRPPATILEQLRSLNASHRLGHLLCRSRRPDFLLDIIQRQGPSQHMPWLAELVQNSEGAFSHLPVQCLCEFLLSSGLNHHNEKYDRIFRQKHAQLVTHLHTLLTSRSYSAAAACEVLEYFLRRLGSNHYSNRVQAIKGIKLVLQPLDEDGMETEHCDDSESWLMRQLATLPHFEAVRPQIIIALRQACQTETDPNYISNYIQFLEQHSCFDSYAETSELVYDMAQLIVERSTIISAILPSIEENDPSAARSLSSCIVIYNGFLQKAKEARGSYQLTECQEPVIVQWANGDECIIQLLVIHAIIILLTYGPVSESEIQYRNLLDQWFPLDCEAPKAYAFDTHEQLLYIPDWLKLRMIRSNVPRLVDAALADLEQSKLMLFVQSFGIPIASMSKLLHALDVAVTEDQVAVAEAVLDKTYMAQLVEVQRRRGAVGGEVFVQALHLREPPSIDDNRFKCVYRRQNMPENSFDNRLNINSQWISRLLNGIFLKTECQGNISDDFRLLLKTLALEIRTKSKLNTAVKTVINYITMNSRSSVFCQSILENCHYFTRLLKIFFTNSSEHLMSSLVESLKIIYSYIKDRNNSLTLLLQHFLSNLNTRELKGEELFIKIRNLDLEDLNTVLKNANALTLEKTGRKLLQQSLQIHSNSILVEALAQSLIDLKLNSDLNFEPAGLFVDWLASIEPELIGSCPELQMDLMFSINRSHVYRTYLQTLLVHRANWGTLHRCIGHLLADCNTRYDPTAVLDFFSALSRNPKLLQGRDKNTPKNVKTEDMLELSQSELKSLVNYMLEEAFIIEKQSNQSIKASANCTELRIPLLLQCISDNPVALSYVTRYLLFIIKAEEQKQINNKVETIIIIDDGTSNETEQSFKENIKLLRKKIAEQFLLVMYMHIPRIIHYIPTCDRDKLFKRIHLVDTSSSTLDKISHCLLTALSATPHIKDWLKRSQEYELMARKMCATNPVLVLRQLQMIAASLEGRTHLEFSIFRSRYHLNLFFQVLGIVELLQPYIYMPEYQIGLENILNIFFSLFKNYGRAKELIPLLNRFIAVLQTYINNNAKRALKFLQKHAHLLNDLQIIHPNVNSLRDLMTGILLPRSDGDIIDEDGEDVLVAVIPLATQEQLPLNWEQLITNLTKLQDVLVALQEIDHLSNRKPAILESILPELCRLMMSPVMPVRTVAHTLVTRHLKFNPVDDSVTSTVFTATLRCLDSSNIDIVVSTLERLPELVACMQENGIPILEKAFTLGIGSDVNTANYINKTINLLNLQIGC